MSNLFKSRSEARNHAAKKGMKVVDCGPGGAFRWMVVPKDSKGASKPPKTDEPFSYLGDGTRHDSKFFASRTEAREFARTKLDSKIIDHAKGRDKQESVVKDLGKQGKRWEVIFPDEKVYPVQVTLTIGGEEVKPVDDLSVSISSGIDDPKDEPQEPTVIMTSGNVLIVMPDGTEHSISRENEIFPDVGLLLIEGDIAAAVAMIEAGKEAKAEQVIDLGTDLKLLDGVLYWCGIEQHSNIAKRIVEDIATGNFDARYVEFMKKLMHNPSYKSVEMLYDFMKHNDLQILENGNILAYKGIAMTADGPRDWKTKLVPNYKGTVVSMPRNMVEDDPTKTCSQGLHIASRDYASEYGSLVEVSVDPADIVSVPYEYKNEKCRCCRYEVLTGTPKPEGAPDVIVVGVMGAILDSIYLDKEEE